MALGLKRIKAKGNTVEKISKTGSFEYIIEAGLIRLSEGTCGFLGIDAHEIRVESFFKMVCVEYKEVVKSLFKRGNKGKKRFKFKVKLEKSDTGDIIFLRIITGKITKEGIIYGTVQDVGRDKECEEELNPKTSKLKLINEFVSNLKDVTSLRQMIRLLLNGLMDNVKAELVLFASYNYEYKSLSLTDYQLGTKQRTIIPEKFLKRQYYIDDEIYNEFVSDSFCTSNSICDISCGIIGSDIVRFFENMLGVGRYIRVPFILYNKLIGVIFLSFKNKLSFSEDDDIVILMVNISISRFEGHILEDVLRTAKDKQISMISNISDIVVIVDNNLTIKYVSPNFIKLFGWSIEVVYGLLSLNLVYPDDMSVVKSLFSEAMSSGEVVECRECRFFCKDGSYKWVNIKVMGDDNDSSVSGFRVYFSDITELKKTETELHMFRLCAEKSPEAVFITNLDGEISYVNEAFSEIYGYESGDAVGNTPRILKSGLYPSKMYLTFWDALLSKESVEGEMINKRKDGRLITVDAINAPILDNNSNIIGFLGLHRDITQRKKEEEELRVSETILCKTFVTIPDAFGISRLKDGIITVVNKGFCDSLGYQEAEIIGKSTVQIGLWESNDVRKELVVGLENLGMVQNKPVKYVDRGGNVKTGLFSGTIIPLDNEPHIMFIIRDMENMLSVREALGQSEERFRQVAEIAGEWIWEVDVHGMFTYSSPNVRELLGYKAEEIVNQSVICDFFVSEHRAKYRREIRDFFKNNKGIYRNQYEFRSKDGRTVTLEVRGKPIVNEEGNLFGYRGTSKDITERLRFIKNLRTFSSAVERCPVSMMVLDTSGIIEYVNKKFIDTMGYLFEEIVGHSIHTLCPEEPEHKTFEQLRNTIVSGRNWFGEVLSKKKNGELYRENIMIIPIFDEGGNVIRFVASEEDLNEKKEFTKKILDTVIETEERERLRYSSELHDGIGPILSTINLYFQMLTESAYDEEQRNLMVSKTQGCINEAIRSIKEISLNLSPSVICHHGIVSGIQSFTNRLNDTGRLVIHFDSNIKIRFEKKLEISVYRIVTELINNTLKYSGASDAWINIDENGSDISIKYEDNGCGFDYEKTMRSRKGLGLLNINQRISSLGGKIDVITSNDMGFKMEAIIPIGALN